ncbi:MAG: FixH family protein [Pseudomonadota bacterium]
MNKPLTGWHILAIFGGCFAVILTVNLTLAFQAVATFPGIVTKNSYVASQRFEADRQAQDALGWTVKADVSAGTLSVAVTDDAGSPIRPRMIAAVLGRATHVADDVTPTFAWRAGSYQADVDIAPGYWTLWLEMTALDGTAFRRRIPMNVQGLGDA